MVKKHAPKSTALRSLIIPAEFEKAIDSDIAELCRGIRVDHEIFLQSAQTAIFRSSNCGRRLSSIKELIGHGKWEAHYHSDLRQRLGFELRTAQRHMENYARFELYCEENGLPDEDEVQVPDSLLQAFEVQWKRSVAGSKPAPNEWICSAPLMEVALQVLHRIDCDPAATKEQAANAPDDQVRFCLEDNGLDPDRRWVGKTLVVPGHQGKLRPWIVKALSEFHSGAMTEGLLLLPANFASDWPVEIARFPIAVTREAPQVMIAGATGLRQKRLQCRLLFIHLTTTPELGALTAVKNDMLVAFGGNARNSFSTLPATSVSKT